MEMHVPRERKNALVAVKSDILVETSGWHVAKFAENLVVLGISRLNVPRFISIAHPEEEDWVEAEVLVETNLVAVNDSGEPVRPSPEFSFSVEESTGQDRQLK